MSNKNKKSTIKKTTKQDIVTDFKTLFSLYKTTGANRKGTMSRNWYRTNSKYGEEYVKFFNTFEELEKEAFGEDIDKFKNEKINAELRRENSELKQDRKKLLHQTLHDEKLLELYKENLTKDFKYVVKPLKEKIKSNKDLLLNFSDLHLGEVVVPEEVNFVNSFNKEIAVDRMNQLFFEVIRYAKKIIVKNLHIICNGDLFCGGIHNELVRNSDLNEVESIFYLQNYLIPKLIEISECFENIYIDIIVGNHSRILPGRPYYKECVTMNYEFIFGRQMKMYFDLMSKYNKNNRIHINVPESPFIIKQIKNTKFLCTHGNILTGEGSGGFLGLPAYSTAMSAAKLYGILHQIGVTDDTKFDHIVAGHIHSTAKIPIFNGGFTFYGGSIIGTNEFSLYKMKGIAKKEQLLLIIDEDGIDGEMNIRLN